MFIAETYESFQGEGPWAGTRSLFIRTSGCNLRCWYCDTPYTSWHPEGNQRTLDELTATIQKCSAEHVVITGGEPMLAAQLTELTVICQKLNRTVTIETAATVDRSVECDLMAISPKRPNSAPQDPHWRKHHEQTRHQPSVIRSLLDQYNCVLKFVINHETDVTDVHDYLTEFPEVAAGQVWLMPQARTQEELKTQSGWVQAAAVANGFQFSPRLHVEQFGDRRGV
ncbi:MAG: 7-carboxy-7-deazaguanine synthase QueE [Fuerstiella sp.]|nr:7-carboxy-7-deazaguanine synthase QueE [Fuerstiella sp.]